MGYVLAFCVFCRDTTHSATGFTSFQLLFGRNVRGPLSLLYKQLAEETTGSKPASDYVQSLQTKLRHAWETAAVNDSAAKDDWKERFDKKAKLRTFQVGDMVLMLSPNATSKLCDWWYTVEEKVGEVTYRVATPDRRKKARLFHVNGIKPWTSPATVLAVQYCEERESDNGDPELINQLLVIHSLIY